MTQVAEETAKLADSLPPEKARALLEYARYLADKADEEAWEGKFDDPRYRAKFDSMLKDADREIAEGRTEPLDPKRL